MLGWGELKRSTAMSNKSIATIATMGIDLGKNSFHVIGLDRRGAIVLRQKWSRGQVEVRLAAMPPCLIGMEACVGAHHLSRKLQAHGHDARLMPAKYVRAYSKGQKARERRILGRQFQRLEISFRKWPLMTRRRLPYRPENRANRCVIETVHW
jgi:transposase